MTESQPQINLEMLTYLLRGLQDSMTETLEKLSTTLSSMEQATESSVQLSEEQNQTVRFYASNCMSLYQVSSLLLLELNRHLAEAISSGSTDEDSTQDDESPLLTP